MRREIKFLCPGCEEVIEHFLSAEQLEKNLAGDIVMYGTVTCVSCGNQEDFSATIEEVVAAEGKEIPNKWA